MSVQLTQIKTFFLENYGSSLDEAVNDFVVEVFNTQGNYPRIETNSKFVSVIYNSLKEVNNK